MRASLISPRGPFQIVEGQLAQLPGGILSWAAAGQEASLIATAVAIAWGTMGFLEWWRGQVAAAGESTGGSHPCSGACVLLI